MANNTLYFSHDCNARTDPKLARLAHKYGMAGIGIYWCVVEMLYENDGYLMRSDCEWIADALRTDMRTLCDIIENSELFVTDDQKFWSESALKRLHKIQEKSQKAANSAIKRWGNANALPTQCEGNAKNKSKVNKSKVNKSIYTPLPPNGFAAGAAVSSKGVTGFVDTETVTSEPSADTPPLETTEEEPLLNNSAGPELQTDDSFGEICKQYADNIGKITPLVADNIRYWADNYSAEWIITAIKEAVLSNVRKPNYISAILDNWDKNGFKAVPQNKAAPPPDTNQGTTRANVENQISIRVRQEIVRNSKSGQPVALDGIRARVRREVEAEYAERLVAK
jgi:DnaD/phage-associated family protein